MEDTKRDEVKTNDKNGVYLYGMILMTSSFLLADEDPAADSYAEVVSRDFFPGGETACCANVLSSLGVDVVLDGNYQGKKTYRPICDFFSDKRVDTSKLVMSDEFDGVEDMVVIGKNTRTCFGSFTAFFSREKKLWSHPDREAIEKAKTIGLDPFFAEDSEEVTKICHELGKPYVTIDCKYDTILHAYSSVNVVSNEFISWNYIGADISDLLDQYTSRTEGLVVFTFGGREIIYGRKGQPHKTFHPYTVNAVSTLGAGDTFKAGAVYATHMHMGDDELVAFASATAGVAISNYPIAYNPPTLEKITALMNA